MILVPLLTITYVILMEGVFYSCNNLRLIGREATSILFLFNRALVVMIFLLLVYKNNRSNKLVIKTTLGVASICIINTISKSFGIFVGSLSNNNYYLVALARSLPYSLFILSIFVIKIFDITRYKMIAKELLVALFIINLLLIGVAFYDSTIDEHIDNINILITVIVLVLYSLMLLLYYASYKVNEYKNKAINHEVQEKLAIAKINSLQIDKVNREEISKIKHDITNQISYIDILLEQGKINDARKYINEFKDKNGEVLSAFISPNEVINSIVNFELTKAKLYGITIKVKAIVPSSLPFKDIDLCSLITNLLDNAIENCNNKDKTPIVFTIFKQNDFIRFYCENTIKNPNLINDKLTTSKKEKGHGYGVKIIKNIAKTYGGYAYFEKKDDKFISDVVLELGEGMKNV